MGAMARTRCSLVFALAIAGVAEATARPRVPRTHEPPQAAAREQTFPIGATWVLQSIDGKPTEGEAPSFRIDDALRGTGFAGCNSFSMTLYPIKGQKLAAGAIAVTRKACDKPVLATERSFLIGLHSLPTWALSESGDLSLKGATGVMLFRRGI